jgi:putative transposase
MCSRNPPLWRRSILRPANISSALHSDRSSSALLTATKPYPDASASLLEGLEETFTVNRLGLAPALMRCLSTTNIIENPSGAVRRVTRRVTRYRDADIALRWTATGFLEAEKHFRKISGANDLWILAAALHRSTENVVDHDLKSA